MYFADGGVHPAIAQARLPVARGRGQGLPADPVLLGRRPFVRRGLQVGTLARTKLQVSVASLLDIFRIGDPLYVCMSVCMSTLSMYVCMYVCPYCQGIFVIFNSICWRMFLLFPLNITFSTIQNFESK